MNPFVIGAIVVAAIIAIILLIILSKTDKKELPKSKPSPKKRFNEAQTTQVAQKDKDIADIKHEAKVEDEASDSTSLPLEQRLDSVKPEFDYIEQKSDTTFSEVDESRDEPSSPGVSLDEEAETKAVAELEKERKERRLKKLRQGLAPTRSGLFSRIGELFRSKKELDPSIIEDIEEVLLTSDVGAKTSDTLLNTIRNALDKNELSDPSVAWSSLKDAVSEILNVKSEPIDENIDKPFVIMVVGVNGVGKTTTIGKLATKYSENGKTVVLAAADTFRAAAVNQLTIWGRRANAEVVKSKEGADPSSVVFDAIKKAKESNADIVIADTAGRLHTQQPLMDELKKIHRVIGKAHETAPHEVLLVLDATTGQNAIQQVSMFKDTLSVTGLVLTKLDGTAKGGVIIGICHEHSIPVRYIGIGEARDDLRKFEVSDFVDALFFKETN